MAAIQTINRLQASNNSYTFKQFTKMIDKGTVEFGNVVQRSYTWEVKRRSEFIWSVIMNYPIPPVYAGRDTASGSKILDIMDGKQRLTTIYAFINDGFALSELKPIPCVDDEGENIDLDISGKKFSELDEEIQDLIRDRTMTVYYYDDISQSEKKEMFKRLNNGKPLTAKNKAVANCSNIAQALEIGTHPLFTDMLTEKAIESKTQAIIVAKCWAMLSMDLSEVSFETKSFAEILEKLSISDSDNERLTNIFNKMHDVHEILLDRKEKKIAKKLYTETHLVSLIPFFDKAIDVEDNLLADFIIDFFENKNNIMSSYSIASGSGSAKNANIVKRHKALQAAFDSFFDSDDVENVEDADVEDDVKSLTDEIMNDIEEDDTTLSFV